MFTLNWKIFTCFNWVASLGKHSFASKFCTTSGHVLRAGVMAMTESTSTEITQTASLVEWRRTDLITGIERCPLASDPVVHHLRICLLTAHSRPSEMSPVCADH